MARTGLAKDIALALASPARALRQDHLRRIHSLLITMWHGALSQTLRDTEGCAQQLELLHIARPLADWHEDIGPALWWSFPIEGAPFSGSPGDSDWPGYHTHFTPLPSAQAVVALHAETQEHAP